MVGKVAQMTIASRPNGTALGLEHSATAVVLPQRHDHRYLGREHGEELRYKQCALCSAQCIRLRDRTP